MNANLSTTTADTTSLTAVLVDNGLGAPAPFGAVAVDRLALLGTSESPASATIWIETTVSLI